MDNNQLNNLSGINTTNWISNNSTTGINTGINTNSIQLIDFSDAITSNISSFDIDRIREDVISAILTESSDEDMNRDFGIVCNILRSKLQLALENPALLQLTPEILGKFSQSTERILALEVNLGTLSQNIENLRMKFVMEISKANSRVDELTGRLETLEFLIFEKLNN